MIINSFSPQEEIASGEEVMLAFFSSAVVSIPFSKIKHLGTFAGSQEASGFTEFSFKSGGEGAPVTRPPFTLIFSSLCDLSSELPLVSEETEALEQSEEVDGDESNLPKGKTAERKI